eukprot:TRINITY_DN3246_c0_g1_i5.p1 TRINITY_DN3246_c0_g1~~TRINITY_DN3246_c0_g1_i5.p1  ORF type:complete len:597 (-),score=180.80 TRINITY_DN3246_c0_g1_i5:204-1994(-)
MNSQTNLHKRATLQRASQPKLIRSLPSCTKKHKNVFDFLLLVDEEKLKGLASRKKGEEVAIVNKSEIKTIVDEIRLRLILGEIEYSSVQEEVFDCFDDEDAITVYELARMLNRRPLEFTQDTLKFARYLVEPRNNPKITFNKLRGEKMKQIAERFKATIGEYTVFDKDSKKKHWKSIAEKFKGKARELKDLLKRIESAPGAVNSTVIDELKKINVQLSPSEADLLLLKMYKKSRQIERLQYAPVLNLLEADPEFKAEESKEVKKQQAVPSAEKQKETETAELETVKKDVKPEEQAEDKHEEKFEDNAKVEVASEQDKDYQDMSEDEIILITQEILLKVGDAIRQRGVTARQLFNNYIILRNINGESEEVIGTNDFVSVIHSLGIGEVQGLEYACLVKVLAGDESEEFIKFADFMLVLNDYMNHNNQGINEEDMSNEKKTADDEVNAESEARQPDISFNRLDKVSMIILTALTDYLINTNTPLYDFFADAIHQEVVAGRNVEVIAAGDFFAALAEIGIAMEDGEHEELKQVLSCNVQGKLSIDKLKVAIEQFAFNEELRSQAQKYYEELAEEGALEENQDHGTINEKLEEQDEYSLT